MSYKSSRRTMPTILTDRFYSASAGRRNVHEYTATANKLLHGINMTHAAISSNRQ